LTEGSPVRAVKDRRKKSQSGVSEASNVRTHLGRQTCLVPRWGECHQEQRGVKKIQTIEKSNEFEVFGKRRREEQVSRNAWENTPGSPLTVGLINCPGGGQGWVHIQKGTAAAGVLRTRARKNIDMWETRDVKCAGEMSKNST